VSWKLNLVSASAAVRSPSGSRLGIRAARAGQSIAPTADWTATSAYSSQTTRSPANAWTASAADTRVSTPPVTSVSRRRSNASVSEPASSPTASSGTTWASPSAPTANEEWVRRKTCRMTAKLVSEPPMDDSVVPTHSRRNAADRRSGPTSASRRKPRGTRQDYPPAPDVAQTVIRDRNVRRKK
jgi:hypothetical protein